MGDFLDSLEALGFVPGVPPGKARAAPQLGWGQAEFPPLSRTAFLHGMGEQGAGIPGGSYQGHSFSLWSSQSPGCWTGVNEGLELRCSRGVP